MIATAMFLTEGKTANQAVLHVLSYLNHLATGNVKGNIRKYYN